MRGIDEFVMGCAAFYCAREFNLKWAAPLSGLLFITPFLLIARGGNVQYWQIAVCFAGVVLLLASASPYDLFHKFCSSRSLVFLGEISYSVYLLQWFIWIGWKHVIARAPLFANHPYFMVLSAGTSVVGIAAISYFAFERPARVSLRDLLGRIRAPKAILLRPALRLDNTQDVGHDY